MPWSEIHVIGRVALTIEREPGVISGLERESICSEVVNGALEAGLRALGNGEDVSLSKRTHPSIRIQLAVDFNLLVVLVKCDRVMNHDVRKNVFGLMPVVGLDALVCSSESIV